MAFGRGSKVTAKVDGDEYKGTVTREYREGGTDMREVELDAGEEHWSGGDTIDVDTKSLRRR